MAEKKDLEIALETTQLFYEAAHTPEVWDKILEKLRVQFGAKIAQISLVCQMSGDELFHATCGPAEVPLSFWLGQKNSFLEQSVPAAEERSRSHKTVQLYMAKGEKDFDINPVFRSSIGPANIDYAFISQLEISEQNVSVVLGLMKSSEEGLFTNSDFEMFGYYKTHLVQAMSHLSYVIEANKSQQISQNIIDNQQLGIVVVDENGYMHMANKTAHNLIDKCHAFRLSSDQKFIVTDRKLKSEFSHHITTVTRHTVEVVRGQPDFEEYYIHIGNENALGGYLVIISTLDRHHMFSHNSRVAHKRFAMIHIIDIEQSAKLDSIRLQNALNITAKEAEVLKDFADGLSPKEIAENRKRSYYTIRNHLQKIMSKTNIHRQAELIRLIYSIMAAGRSH